MLFSSNLQTYRFLVSRASTLHKNTDEQKKKKKKRYNNITVACVRSKALMTAVANLIYQ